MTVAAEKVPAARMGTMKEDTLKTWLGGMQKLAAAKGFTVECWGESGGFSLLGFVREAAGEGPGIYLSAGIHGDEPAGPLAIERLLRADRLPRTAGWVICPLLNPAGLCGESRDSPDGIDLNRDYLRQHSGEVRAHCRWLNRLRPNDLYLSLHEDWETLGFYLYEINTSRHPSIAGEILTRVQTVVAIEKNPWIDDHRVAAPGLIQHRPEADEPDGWPEAIFHARTYPHLSYTFETPSSLALKTRVLAHEAATGGAVEAFLKEWRQK